MKKKAFESIACFFLGFDGADDELGVDDEQGVGTAGEETEAESIEPSPDGREDVHRLKPLCALLGGAFNDTLSSGSVEVPGRTVDA